MADYTKEVRGVPLWLLRRYLEEAGGQLETDGWIYGNGWSANLVQLTDYQIGSLRLKQVRLSISGEPEAVGQVQAFLEKKLAGD